MKQASVVTESRLRQLLERYVPVGIVWGKELCLRPADALRLVDDLEALGITILGVDGWYFSSPEHERKGWLIPDLGVDLYVGDKVLQSSDPSQESARVIRDYLMHSLPEHAQFVSLSLHIPMAWDVFPEERT